MDCAITRDDKRTVPLGMSKIILGRQKGRALVSSCVWHGSGDPEFREKDKNGMRQVRGIEATQDILRVVGSGLPD